MWREAGRYSAAPRTVVDGRLRVQFVKRCSERAEDTFAEQHEPRQFDGRILLEKRDRGRQRDSAGQIDRISIDTARDGRQRDAATSVSRGEFQRRPISAGQEFRLARPATVPARADGMDHMSGRQVSGDANHGRTGWAAIGIPAVGVVHDGRSTAAVDRPVDASSAQQAAVGRIDDGIHLLVRDVADRQFEDSPLNFAFHRRDTWSERRPAFRLAANYTGACNFVRVNFFRLPQVRSMCNIVRLLSITLVGVVLTAQAAARDIFVSNVSGDDRHEGRAIQSPLPRSGPVRSIAKALRLAAAGDRIVIQNTGQPYREAISLIGSRLGGSLRGPLTIEGNGATIDGTVAIADDAWSPLSDDVFTCRPARLGQQQLFLDDRAARHRPVAREAVNPPTLAPLEWTFWRGQILFRVEPGRMPQDYRPSCCGLQTGITLYYVDNVLIRDLVVRGFGVDGVAVHDVVRDTRLERVSSQDNGLAGFSARGATWVEFDACSGAGNGQAQLRVEDFARVWAFGCRFVADTAPAVLRSGGELVERNEPFARIGG